MKDVLMLEDSQRSKFFVVDGMALLFRSYYAMGRVGLTSPEGRPIGAIYGFIKVMQKILKEQDLSFFAVTWDLKEKTFRHKMYDAYKANRSAAPEELIEQIPVIQKMLVDMGVPAFSMAGYEGDDIIGTLCKMFSDAADVYIVSSDKDFMQLVSSKVKLFSLKMGDKFEEIADANVVDYFGVGPDKVIDVLSIMGDASDNVPGVKGIGEKGAAKLIQEFGSLEGVYENIDKIKNERLRGLLAGAKDMAFLSKKLVTIDQSVPVEITEAQIRYNWSVFSSNPLVHECLKSKGMNSLLKGMNVQDSKKPQWPNIPAPSKENLNLFGETLDEKNEPVAKVVAVEAAPKDLQLDWGKRSYTLIRGQRQLDKVLEKIKSKETKFFAFDTETTGLDPLECEPIGFSLCFEEGSSCYVPCSPTHLAQCVPDENDTPLEPKEVLRQLNDALQHRSALILGHNIKFDMHQMLNKGVSVGPKPLACTMIAAWLIDPSSGGYGLDAQTLKVLGLHKIPTSELIGKGTGRTSMLEVALEKLYEYACEDVDATFRLWKRFKVALGDPQDVETGQEDEPGGVFKKAGNVTSIPQLFWQMEMPLLRVIMDMERSGVHIQGEYLAELASEIQQRLIEIEEKVFVEAGERFNLASPKQLGAILFEKLKVHETLGYKGKLAKTTLGYKTDAGVLETFVEHPVVALVQEFRELAKLLNTYIIVLPQLVKKSTQRIHTQFNQIGTATGRLSSNDPNLQNIPVRTPLGKKVRKAFSASKQQNVITSVDYSQIELRVLAHLSGDPTMIAAFNNGADIHRETAAKILGKEPQLVTSEERSNAKTINFGIIYGMGPQRLAREQGIGLNEAKAFIEKYFLNFALVREYLERQKIHAHQNGFVQTFFGRRRPISFSPSLNQGEVKSLENVAINSPIQGTAADIMKLGMLRAHHALKFSQLQTRMLLQVHDELVLEGPATEVQAVKVLLKVALEGVVSFAVPLIADVSFGPNWLEAKSS
jgi:DNA polymerase I